MPWDPDQYLKFADERGRPCQDLVARIDVAAPARVVDLGCGPGNSTATALARWPGADVMGVDSSPEMIAKARAGGPGRRWVVADIGAWASEAGDSFDVVFSNAALQWVPDHADLLPRLFGRVARGGALAFQMPANYEAPAHEAMRAPAAAPAWRDQFAGRVRGWRCDAPAVYYDVLAPQAARVDIWTTEYLHVLPSVEAIVEWYRGSGMRPFLQALASDDDRERFAAEYRETLRPLYPPQPDGRVLFPSSDYSRSRTPDELWALGLRSQARPVGEAVPIGAVLRGPAVGSRWLAVGSRQPTWPARSLGARAFS